MPSYTRQTRSVLTRRTSRVQVALNLEWIDEARADGDVIVTSGCCGVEPAGRSGDAGGVFSPPDGEPGDANFLRRPRRGSEVMGSGQRSRCPRRKAMEDGKLGRIGGAVD